MPSLLTITICHIISYPPIVLVADPFLYFKLNQFWKSKQYHRVAIVAAYAICECVCVRVSVRVSVDECVLYRSLLNENFYSRFAHLFFVLFEFFN